MASSGDSSIWPSTFSIIFCGSTIALLDDVFLGVLLELVLVLFAVVDVLDAGVVVVVVVFLVLLVLFVVLFGTVALLVLVVVLAVAFFVVLAVPFVWLPKIGLLATASFLISWNPLATKLFVLIWVCTSQLKPPYS